MSPGFLMALGSFNVTYGVVTRNFLCVVAGLFCLYAGFNNLKREFEEQEHGPKNGNKKGHSEDS